jgi:hypothetical protein
MGYPFGAERAKCPAYDRDKNGAPLSENAVWKNFAERKLS